jgi:hypothetical protein
MMDIVQLSLVILLSISLVILLVAWKRRVDIRQGKMNYRLLFIIGITFLPARITLSISTGNPGLIGISGLGAAYLYISLSHKDEWSLKK